MKTRIFVNKVHFYLSLLAALPLFILCITGSLLVYKEALDDYFNRVHMEVPVGPQLMSIAAMEERLKTEHLPGTEFAGVVLPRGEGKSYYFWMKTPPQGSFWTVAYIDPYTGAFKGTKAWEDWTLGNAVWWLTDIHYSFKWGRPGSYVVAACSTLLFLSVLTGVFLWIPRRFKFHRASFVPKVGKRWKQTAFNFHSVVGIYVTLVLLAITTTGVMITFYEPMEKFFHAITLSPPPHDHPKLAPESGRTQLSFEEMIASAKSHLKEKYGIEPHAEAVTYATAENAAVEVSFQGNPSYAGADHTHVWVNPYSGAVIEAEAASTFNRGQKAIAWVGPIHYGSWGAIFGEVGDHITRLIWLFSALSPLFLLVSGFSIVKKSRWKSLAGKNKRPTDSVRVQK